MNPARLLAFRQRSHAEKEGLFPATIRIGTTATAPAPESPSIIATTAGLVRKESPLQSGGYNDGDDIKFRVSKERLPELPEVGTRLVWIERNIVFVISSTRDGTAQDPRWVLGCRQKTS
jgi:hypothetical protein